MNDDPDDDLEHVVFDAPVDWTRRDAVALLALFAMLLAGAYVVLRMLGWAG